VDALGKNIICFPVIEGWIFSALYNGPSNCCQPLQSTIFIAFMVFKKSNPQSTNKFFYFIGTVPKMLIKMEEIYDTITLP
jgi:hypothetical protein